MWFISRFFADDTAPKWKLVSSSLESEIGPSMMPRKGDPSLFAAKNILRRNEPTKVLILFITRAAMIATLGEASQVR
jgi:hypothetical protein